MKTSVCVCGLLLPCGCTHSLVSAPVSPLALDTAVSRQPTPPAPVQLSGALSTYQFTHARLFLRVCVSVSERIDSVPQNQII